MTPMLSVYAACPPADDCTPQEYRSRLAEASRWAEAAGLRGLLVFSDNDSLDPWSLSQFILDHTDRLVPMIAVNPMYMHPFNTARLIGTIGYMYRRQLDLNLVSGGFSRHLRQVGDPLDHDRRYGRLVEYGEIVRRLLLGTRPITFAGEYYQIKSASIARGLPAELMPRIFVSGSSDACLQAHQTLGATRLTYPREIGEYEADESASLKDIGVGFGIIARENAADAWSIAQQRFPADPLGEEMHDYAVTTVESQWHISLAHDVDRTQAPEETYWLYPFRSGRTFSPYLVGTYADVGHLVSRYMTQGVSTIILDDFTGPDDLQHTMTALTHAEKLSVGL